MTEHPTHGSPGTANYIDARTTWFDQAVTTAQQHGVTQVVIIAAGFDSRAYRLHSPGLQVRPALICWPALICDADLLPDHATMTRPLRLSTD